MPITDAHGVKRGEENVFRRKKTSERELARDSASTLPWQKGESGLPVSAEDAENFRCFPRG